MFDHPGTIFVCRHCGKPAGYDPEMCLKCGPICGSCWEQPLYPCRSSKVTLTLPPRDSRSPEYPGA